MKKKGNFWKGLSSLLCTVGGCGSAYIAAQCGSLAYIALREVTNLAFGSPLTSIPEILKEYAVYTSAAALIGEVSGYVFHKKIWKSLGGE